MANAAGKRRGGRKPGTWTLLTEDKLREWRAANKVSRARLAKMLGVSSTSIQNWEFGTVASMKMQRRLAELMAAGPAVIAPPPRHSPAWGGRSESTGAAAITATGTIVASYVQNKKVETAELQDLVKAVRQALS
jgi:transcriptional regulator with XRE-family HTH domain